MYENFASRLHLAVTPLLCLGWTGQAGNGRHMASRGRWHRGAGPSPLPASLALLGPCAPTPGCSHAWWHLLVPPPSLLSYVVPVSDSAKGLIPSISALMDRLTSATAGRGDPVLGQVEPELCPRAPGAGQLGEGELFESFGAYPLGPREPVVRTGGSFPCE